MGAEADFVEKMNAKAKSIGMKNTHFVDCTGLHDPEHYSTAYDIALLLKYALHNDTFRDVIESHFYSTPGTNVHRMGLRIIVPCLRICRIQASPVERSWVVKPVTPPKPDIAWPALLRFTTGSTSW